MQTWRTLTLLCCALAPAIAQEPPVRAPAAEPGPRALQRAIDDTRAAAKKLFDLPHSFEGTVRFDALSRPAFGAREEIPFRGAWWDGLELLHLDKHTVLKHGDHQVVSAEGGAWTLPQGDAPDCPFSPIALAKYLGEATIDAWEPTSDCDRPAIRVHATWTGDVACHLLHETNHPNSQVQALLERFPLIMQRQPERVRVDAAVCIDPASRSLYSAVVRFAVVDLRERVPEDTPQPCPEGLPALAHKALLECVYTIAVRDPTVVPMPDLDAELRLRLAWPPPVAAKPAAAPPASTPAPTPPVK